MPLSSSTKISAFWKEDLFGRIPLRRSKICGEVHHIGNNINQIARSVNVGIARAEDAKRGLYLLDQVYELMHEKDFPALKIGSRIVVPKESFIRWVEQNTGGAA